MVTMAVWKTITQINNKVNGVETIMSHYTVGYHDTLNNHYEICEYADDAYNAIKQAKEDLPGLLTDHSSEYVIKEK